MSEAWIQQYILLAFRIDKVVQAAYASPFVEIYYVSVTISPLCLAE